MTDKLKEKKEEVEEVTTADVTDTPERKKETDEILKDAMPMKKEDPVARVIRKGFVRGVVVQRVNAYGEPQGYGVLTGETTPSDEDSVALLMTDGRAFNEHHCRIITDVNKDIMKFVGEEQARIQLEANNFCDTIQSFMTKVIYE